MSGLETDIQGFRLAPQQRHLFLLQSTGKETYRARAVLRIEGELRVDRLATALAAVVARHEILRAVFPRLPSLVLPLQAVGDAEVELRLLDLTSLPPSRVQGAADGAAADCAAAPFDLARGPLLRAFLARLERDQHLLVLNLPALCCDAPGLAHMVAELADAYAAPGRRADAVQYADIAEVFNDLLGSADAAAGRAYWREARPASPPALPFAREAAAGGPFAPIRIALPLRAEVLDRLVRQGVGTTPGEALLVCWQILLARLSGSAEMVLGYACDGRGFAGLDRLPGLFRRYLPLAAGDLDVLPPRQLATRAATAVAALAEWQDFYSWDGESDAGAPEGGLRSLSYGFEVAPSLAVWQAAGVTFRSEQIESEHERFHVKLACRETVDGWVASLCFDPAFYAATDAAHLLERLAALAESAAERPLDPAGDLDFLTAAERHQVRLEWNATALGRRDECTVPELIAAQVERHPDRVAVESFELHLTGGELLARADRWAAWLTARGCGVDLPVAIVAERSPEMLIGLLATWRCGAFFVPVAPELPPARQALLLVDSGARWVLTQRRLSALPAGDRELLDLDGPPPRRAGGIAPPAASASPNHLAYVIYTSGSTGRPKGVMVSHRAIANRLRWMQEVQPLAFDDRVLQKTALSFDASLWELCVPLFAGARVVLARPGGQRDPAYLIEECAVRGVTVLQMVPSMLRALLEQPGAERLSALRRLYCGGEALSGDLVDAVTTRIGIPLHNLYGPTETAIDAAAWECHTEDRVGPPLGRPIAGLRIHLLDHRGQLVPPGGWGEIHIGGQGLARGYFGQPDVTAARFVPDPFAAAPGERLFRSGDLGRHRRDGVLEFGGRLDHQVKLRGFRIELGEIEAALRRQPGVGDAVVTLREEGGTRQLVAYVEPAADYLRVSRGLHRLPNGLSVAALNGDEAEFLYCEVFEQSAYLRHGIHLEDGDCVLDAGANIGLFTLLVHNLRRNLRVFAFEPVPQVFDLLRTNVALYGLDVRLFQLALGATEGEVALTFYPRWSGMSGAHADPQKDGAISQAVLARSPWADSAEDLLAARFAGETVVCPQRTLSAVLRECGLDRIDLLKVDVERSELDVLCGLSVEDWRKVRQVVVEAEDEDGRAEQIASLLAEQGFGVRVEPDQFLTGTRFCLIYASRSELSADPGPAAEGALLSARRGTLTAAELRARLAQELPEPMVPAALVVLASLPRMTSGKPDRQALPAPAAERAEGVAPRNETEAILASIWSEVLGLHRVGVHDNFFELGGDSILSIQVVNRAHRAGLGISPRLIFRHQTIAELALAVAAAVPSPLQAVPQPVRGAVPLTPIQRDFFLHVTVEPHHFNQALLLTVRERLRPDLLRSALTALSAHHDALRLAFSRTLDGWVQTCTAAGEAQGRLLSCDLTALAGGALSAAIESAAEQAQRSLDLARPPLWAGVLFSAAMPERDRLLLFAHHLLVDAVSWRILLEDMEAAYRALEHGHPVALPPPTLPFTAWSEGLAKAARTAFAAGAAKLWLEEARRAPEPLPVDFAATVNRVGSSAVVARALDREETRTLLEEVPRAYRTRIDDVLLTALALAYRRWTGAETLLVDLEGHGREEEGDDADLSRTIGWFTTVAPVVLRLAVAAGPAAALKSVKEQLRQVAGRRREYGLLRYWAGEPELERRLGDLPQAEMSFNYLGQHDRALAADSPFAAARETAGRPRSPRQERRYAIEIDGGVSGGRLQVAFTFSRDIHRGATIATLADGFFAALRELIAHCRSAASTFTPSDFPLARIDAPGLDRLLAAGHGIEDLYGVSPLQQGLLFHMLESPRSGHYFVQWSCELEGEVDVPALQRAWQLVSERHAVFRTAFSWEEAAEQLQVVVRRVELPWRVEDWSEVLPERLDAALRSWLVADQRRGFDPRRAPLMRLALLRLGERRSRLVWSYHHLLLDGWCLPIVLGEAFTAYQALRRGEEPRLAPVRPYRDFIAWLRQQPSASARAFWRQTLAGFRSPNRLPNDPVAESEAAPARPEDARVHLSASVTAALQALGRRHQLTLNTLAQGMWALLLGRRTESWDVVFGGTVSGRPAELAGVETMVGLFINTLPVRARLDPGRSVLAWLADLQEQQSEARQFEHCSLLDVQEWSEVGKGQALFETILTFENYPLDETLAERAGGTVDRRAGSVLHLSRNSNPLTLLVGTGGRLWLELLYDERRFSAATAGGYLEDMELLFGALVEAPEAPLGDLLAQLEKAEQGRRAGQGRQFSEFARQGLLRRLARETAPVFPGQGKG